jgi:hypothetical protein
MAAEKAVLAEAKAAVDVVAGAVALRRRPQVPCRSFRTAILTCKAFGIRRITGMWNQLPDAVAAVDAALALRVVPRAVVLRARLRSLAGLPAVLLPRQAGEADAVISSLILRTE